jgi:hypothetical protein
MKIILTIIIVFITNQLCAKEIDYTKVANFEYACSPFETLEGLMDNDAKSFILKLKIFYNGTFPAKDEIYLDNEKFNRVSDKFSRTHRFVNKNGDIIDINGKRNFLQVLEEIQLTQIYRTTITFKKDKYQYRLLSNHYSLCSKSR